MKMSRTRYGDLLRSHKAKGKIREFKELFLPRIDACVFVVIRNNGKIYKRAFSLNEPSDYLRSYFK